MKFLPLNRSTTPHFVERINKAGIEDILQRVDSRPAP